MTQTLVVLTRGSDINVGLYLIPLLCIPRSSAPQSLLVPCPLRLLSIFPRRRIFSLRHQRCFRPTDSLILTTNTHDRSCDTGDFEENFLLEERRLESPPLASIICFTPTPTFAGGCTSFRLLQSNPNSNSVFRCSCVYSLGLEGRGISPLVFGYCDTDKNI